MEQTFPKWTNKVPLLIGVVAPIVLIGVVAAIWYYFSPKFTDVGYAPQQPVPFSHKLHAGEMGMDCRYCHSTVEKVHWAAIPPTSTCMGCHDKVLKDSPKLEPLRTAHQNDKPLQWVKIHQLPDFAHFDHSSHLTAGVGCASCHNRVDQMPVVTLKQPLSMSWCLECHRNPTPALRPFDKITDMNYDPVAAGYDPKKDAQRKREVNPPQHCGGCHY